MIRVVIDTNIFISALLQPQGLPAKILMVALTGERVRLCISAEIYSEYEEVVRRPRASSMPKRRSTSPGDHLRTTRLALGITLRDVHRASMKLARRLRNQRFILPARRLQTKYLCFVDHGQL